MILVSSLVKSYLHNEKTAFCPAPSIYFIVQFQNTCIAVSGLLIYVPMVNTFINFIN